MDGALRPNQLLEQAPVVLSIDAPDNIVSQGGQVFFSSGATVLSLDLVSCAATSRRVFESTVSALALSPVGDLAVGLDNGRIVVQRVNGAEQTIDEVEGRRLVCVTGLLFLPSGELAIAQGSANLPPGEWKRDLMDRGATGAVWRLDLGSGKATRLADRLAWPYGLINSADGALVATESWRHRVIALSERGSVRPLLEDLPGYPGRMAPAGGGGYWLAVFAPRSQLIEFVQREPAFRRAMMAEIASEHWAAPTLSAASTFLEPLQGGAQKHLGMLKPWAPSRSYGLVVRLDAEFQPVASYHSRADGRRHGIVSCAEAGGRLLAASKGGGVIVAIDARQGKG